MKKNIVFIMADQYRQDHIGCTPNSKIKTPNIDRIGEGTTFLDCLSVNPVCMPARTALLTGKYSHQIGTLVMSGDLSRQHPTYARALQNAGYQTAAIGKFHWLQSWPFKTTGPGQGHDVDELENEIKKFGFDYIWEASGKQLCSKTMCHYAKYLEKKGLITQYRDHIEKRKQHQKMLQEKTPLAINHFQEGEPFPFSDNNYIDTVVGDKALEVLQTQEKEKPFSLFVSFSSPHPPWDAPQSYLDKVSDEPDETFLVVPGHELDIESKKRWQKIRRNYKAMCLLVDDQIGRLLDYLEETDQMKNTLIIFTSDHGDMLGDRGQKGKSKPWPQSAGVPALIRHPDYLNQQINKSPIESIDLTATILDYAGLNPKEALAEDGGAYASQVPCKSLMPLVKNEKESIRKFTFSEHDGWQMIQSKEWFYFRSVSYHLDEKMNEHLYNRNADPTFLNNLINDDSSQEILQLCRKQNLFILDSTQATQTSWAKYPNSPEFL